jgi:hypothetical protein
MRRSFRSLARSVAPSFRALAAVLLAVNAAFPFPAALAQRRPLLRPAARDYFAGKFVLIPHDDRPLSLQQPKMLARVADHDLILPPARAMAGGGALIEWAKTLDYGDSDGAIVSLDAIADGAQAQPTGQSELIRWIRARRPGMPIFAFTSNPSEPSARAALELVSESALNFLLVAGGAARGRLPEEAAARGLADKVGVIPAADGTGEGPGDHGMAMILISRMANRRFGFTPKIFPAFSSVEGQNSSPNNSPLQAGVRATISAAGGVEVSSSAPPPNNAGRSVDALLFVHTPQTSDANRTALVDAIVRNLDKGVAVALADLSETKESKDAVIAELRRRKVLDKLVTYASSVPGDPTANARGETVARAVTHALTFLDAVRFMRDDVTRARRFDRAHNDLLFSRYLSDWAYGLTVRSKLEEFARAELKADPNRLGASTERAEAFAFEQLKQTAETLFNEQFKHNVHAILLSSGERAQFEISMLQRLQVRLPSQSASEADIQQSVYIPQLNFQELTPLVSQGGRARWSMDGEGMDERIVRRFETTDWARFKSDVEEVELAVKLTPRPGSQEAYTIASARKRNGRRIMITAPTNQGAFYALSKLEMIGAEGGLAADFQISEAPGFARRGVAERLRDTSWTTGDRLETLRFLGLARMNRYVYASQGDPLRGERWREAYGDDALAKFKQLAKVAEENFVRVVYAVSPEASITYSSDEDASALARKLTALAAAGVRDFALCFNESPDNSGVLSKEEDRSRFKSLAAAQARLINFVHGLLRERLKQADSELYVAPAVLADASANAEYLKELGASIPQGVLLFRPETDSVDGSGARAKEWRALANRPPVIWSDFPTNVSASWRLFLGAKRAAPPAPNPAPGEESNGFIASATNQPNASRLPVMTAADYAWDPRTYNPQRSLDRALNLLYDERARAGARLWAQVYGDPGATIFDPLFQSQPGEINLEAMARKLAELQGSLESFGVTLNQSLTRGELATVISKTRSAIEKLAHDPKYEKLPNGNYRPQTN